MTMAHLGRGREAAWGGRPSEAPPRERCAPGRRTRTMALSPALAAAVAGRTATAARLPRP